MRTETLEWPVVTPGPKHVRSCSRSSRMYVIIVALWALLCVPMLIASYAITQRGFHRSPVIGMMTVFTALFICYFWLNGVKDVVYPIVYRVTSWRSQLPPPRASRSKPLVGLLYVTCNDFSADSLAASIVQDYANYEVVILDDSTKPQYVKQVNQFVAKYAQVMDIKIVRRTNKPHGFKAGNLNYFLRREGRRLEYFVIVDSDEVLPPYFITRALDYMEDPEVGIVQANHVATRNRTTFMRTFAPGVDAHWPAYQLVKAHAGFMSLLGHGAMVSREAYVAGGGFPEVVAEDIGLAIDAACAGYRTAFAPDIRCEEEFPPDYPAFVKRHRKWTEGNMEFMRRYTRRILFGKGLRWYERLDIVLFTYSLPLTCVFSLYVVMNAVLFPVIKFHFEYPVWMLVPTVICLIAPMINDVITWRKAPTGKLTSYLLHSVLLFGSMFFVSLYASARTMFKGSVFHVTPKTSERIGFWSAVRSNKLVLVSGVVLAVIVELASGSVLPVILLLLPVIFVVYLSVMNAADDMSSAEDKHCLLEEEK